MNILKRNGTEVPYDAEKIRAAVLAAGALDSTANYVVGEVGKWVLAVCTNGIPDVEQIQNKVEHYLYCAEPAVQRRFITYRDHRKDLRILRMPTDAISDFTFFAKYSTNGMSYADTVNAIHQMHQRKLTSLYVNDKLDKKYFPVLSAKLDEAIEMMHYKEVMPSMRTLQFVGAAIEQNNARLYNCSAAHINHVNVVSNAFFYLLCGCGVGYSVEERNIRHIPKLVKIDRSNVYHHQIQDSIEGWRYALGELLNAHFYNGLYVEFDYSHIRLEGVELKTSGGKAPGHLPLKKLLEDLREFFTHKTEMTSFDWHRVMCMTALAVMSGGIRRSSLLCLCDAWDHATANCKKIDNWWNEMPELAMANISVRITDTDEYRHEHGSLLGDIAKYGEPGIFLAPWPALTNPCGEIGFDHTHGFGFCNLTEVNLATCQSVADWRARSRAAVFLGKIQSLYNDFGDSDTYRNLVSDNLLGASMTGVWDACPEIVDWVLKSQEGKSHAYSLQEYDVELSDMLGVEYAARVTTGKPSGTTSLVLGGISSGLHCHHSKRYFRRIKAKPNEDAYKYFKAVNPHMCYEVSDSEAYTIWPMYTDGKTYDEVGAVEQLDIIVHAIQNWVAPGYRRGKVQHNVSCTIVVEDDEWPVVEEYLERHESRFQSLSFIGKLSDTAYPNMPRQAVRTKADEILWLDLIRNYKHVDWSKYSGHAEIGSACDGPSCEL